MKKTAIRMATIVLATVLPASVVLADEASLDTEKAKVSYSIGLMIGERVLKTYDDIDYELLMQAMQAQHQGKETLMSVEDAGRVLQEQQQKQADARSGAAKAEGEKYLETNAKREGVQVTDSGLQYEVLQESDGAKPTSANTVKVHYVGTLLNGKEFDSSVARGEPATFPLRGVIPGWTEGLQLMNVGSKFKFVIPSELAYGDRGAGPNIGPGETLVFEVELLEIVE